MYRYCVDNAVTYTSEDFVLFRESPFAVWMERLTLENPDHGILPDLDSAPPSNFMLRQDDLADTLRAEEKHVVLVDWNEEESARRAATLDAMRRGVDFVVNGQLALGPLSGSANLLMRTSGFSEFGSYLYIPCDTQGRTTLNSAFRLCFLADLLHSLQGQLPPQMLIIRGGSDLLPLQTEDHIYHYRAVKQRFMEAMRTFRKHRMPDPVDSAHFGRWSDCANEVLKQRALQGGDEPVPALEEIDNPLPMGRVAAVGAQPLQADSEETPQGRLPGGRGMAVSGTLADQARMVQPGAATTGLQAQNLARSTPALDSALENLEFIGSSLRAPSIGSEPVVAVPVPTLYTESPADEPETAVAAPAQELMFSVEEISVLRQPAVDPRPAANSGPIPDAGQAVDAAPTPDLESAMDLEPVMNVVSTPEVEPAMEGWQQSLPDTGPVIAAPGSNKPHPLDSSGFFVAPGDSAVIDRDDVASRQFDVDCFDDSDYRMPGLVANEPAEAELPVRPFSNSLNTSGTDKD